MLVEFFHTYRAFLWSGNILLSVNLYYADVTFPCLWNSFMFMKLFHGLEICSAFKVSQWLWNFSMYIELFHTYWIFPGLWKFSSVWENFPCLRNFSMLVKLFNAGENFLDLKKYSMSVCFFHAYGFFRCFWNCSIWFWNFPILIELLRECGNFQCSYGFSIFVEQLDAYGTFPCLWNFFMSLELFYGHGSFTCIFWLLCFSMLVESFTHFVVVNYV